MKKKLTAIILAGMMVFSLSSCMGNSADDSTQPPANDQTQTQAPATNNDDSGNNQESSSNESNEATEEVDTRQLPPMTQDNIHLTYALWDDYEMAEYLAEKFTEKYPNITVEIVPLPLDGYNDALLALASSGQFPDIYQYLHNVDMCISNGWLRDITEFWDNDPDVDYYLDSLKNVGRLDGNRVFTMAGEYLPITVFVDNAVFDKLNVPMPDYNWTYNEMTGLMSSMTRPDQNIFGYNSYLGIVSFGPVVLGDSIGEFGWDGSSYDFEGGWARALNEEAEFRRLGYRALQGTDEWEAASGDRDMWPGNSGLVAIQHDAWWTMNNIYTKSEAIEKGIRMIPYVQPRGDNSQTENKLAFIDMAAVSDGTDYPREAYELLKFMTWSGEGWLHRIEAFKTLTLDTGELMYEVPNCLPLTKDETVWAEYRKLYSDDEYWDAFFSHSKNPVPLGGGAIPGFSAFLSEVYGNGDYNGYASVEDAVINGALDANDVAAELTKRGNEYYQKALEVLYQVYGR